MAAKDRHGVAPAGPDQLAEGLALDSILPSQPTFIAAAALPSPLSRLSESVAKAVPTGK